MVRLLLTGSFDRRYAQPVDGEPLLPRTKRNGDACVHFQIDFACGADLLVASRGWPR